jgi:hypothetical protein
MIDALLIMTGDGGDLVFNGTDILTVSGYENQPILAMFGDTGDWHWNDYLTETGNNNEFISETETALRTYALNSAGRLKDEQAINNDLAYLKEISGTSIKVTTQITRDDRLDCRIDFNGQIFYMNWNPWTGFLTYSI